MSLSLPSVSSKNMLSVLFTSYVISLSTIKKWGQSDFRSELQICCQPDYIQILLRKGLPSWTTIAFQSTLEDSGAPGPCSPLQSPAAPCSPTVVRDIVWPCHGFKAPYVKVEKNFWLNFDQIFLKNTHMVSTSHHAKFHRFWTLILVY